MNVWFWVFIAYVLTNFVLLISMIFFERKTLTSIISWLTVLTFLPGLGYLFYLVFGSGLSLRVKRMIARHKLYEIEYDQQINQYIMSLSQVEEEIKDNKEIIKHAYSYRSVLCPNNDIKFFLNGESKIESLIKDLQNAKKSINIEYYIFADDKVGKKVMNILIAKAKEGVKVRLIFDSIGCLGAPRRFFRKLKKAGGEVGEFFPPFLYIRMINLKMNYRNHKKLVIIDGKIGYTGGINIRDDHMGLKKKVSPWRDTHVRIAGSGVFELQKAFLNDWRYIKNEDYPASHYINEGLFPAPLTGGNSYMQLLVSGPDRPVHTIEETYVKLITNAKKQILIQTPYFVPDETFMTAIRIAVASGVKVKIMIPRKPDYKSIFWVSLSYLKELVPLGVDVYLYEGFLHSKVLVVDDEMLSVGTCNIDNRSFSLNFEDTVLIYDKNKNAEYKKCFENDIKMCKFADTEYFKKKRLLNKFAQAVFRLFSPIL